jgi:hypothetical protein
MFPILSLLLNEGINSSKGTNSTGFSKYLKSNEPVFIHSKQVPTYAISSYLRELAVENSW